MSFDELPTMIRNSPGSTTHRMSRSSIRSDAFDSGIDTVFDSPGEANTLKAGELHDRPGNGRQHVPNV